MASLLINRSRSLCSGWPPANGIVRQVNTLVDAITPRTVRAGFPTLAQTRAYRPNQHGHRGAPFRLDPNPTTAPLQPCLIF